MKLQDQKSVRFTRNSYLTKTDKFLISDYPMTEEDKALVIEYRQKLRDITVGIDSIEHKSDINWPTLPEFLRGKMV